MKLILCVISFQLIVIIWKLCEIWTQIYDFKTIVKLYFDEFEKNTRRIEKNTRGSEKDE